VYILRVDQLNETSTIVLNRKKAWTFKFTDVEVSLNGSKVALLKNGDSESITIPAGTHTLAIIPVGFGSMFAQSYQMMFVAQAGESYSFVIEPAQQNFTIVLSGSSESIKKATLESVPSTQTEAVEHEQLLEPKDAEPLGLKESEEQHILQEHQEHKRWRFKPVYGLVTVVILGFFIYQDYQELQDEQARLTLERRNAIIRKKNEEKRQFDEERTNPAWLKWSDKCNAIGRWDRQNFKNKGYVPEYGVINNGLQKKLVLKRKLTLKQADEKSYYAISACHEKNPHKRFLYGPDS